MNFFLIFLGCKKKADKVILSSAYHNLEPFKTKMESFISLGMCVSLINTYDISFKYFNYIQG